MLEIYAGQSCPFFDRHIVAPVKTDEATYYKTLVQIWNQSVHETLHRSKHFKRKLFYLLNLFLFHYSMRIQFQFIKEIVYGREIYTRSNDLRFYVSVAGRAPCPMSLSYVSYGGHGQKQLTDVQRWISNLMNAKV